MTNTLVADLQRQLDLRSSAKTKQWWERYLKGSSHFRGVPLPSVRSALTEWWHRHQVDTRTSAAMQRAIAVTLLRQPHTEDKLAGMVLIGEFLLPRGRIDWRRELPSYGRLFTNGHLADWNSCDWFCVKVLGPMVRRFGKPCAAEIGRWRHSRVLWQQRASAVAFVNLAKEGEKNFPGFVPMVLRSCQRLVGNGERFAQTGAGWVLRELGRADEKAVLNFLRKNLSSLSREALMSATEKMPARARRTLGSAHKHHVFRTRKG